MTVMLVSCTVRKSAPTGPDNDVTQLWIAKYLYIIKIFFDIFAFQFIFCNFTKDLDNCIIDTENLNFDFIISTELRSCEISSGDTWGCNRHGTFYRSFRFDIDASSRLNAPSSGCLAFVSAEISVKIKKMFQTVHRLSQILTLKQMWHSNSFSSLKWNFWWPLIWPFRTNFRSQPG